MTDPDFHGESAPPEGTAYPDIDEIVQYPWQGNQPSTSGDLIASVIDPRLYQDLYPSENLNAGPATDDADGSSSDNQAYPSNYGGGDASDDASFVNSDDESERYVFY